LHPLAARMSAATSGVAVAATNNPLLPALATDPSVITATADVVRHAAPVSSSCKCDNG
jgi:hypothetical protein